MCFVLECKTWLAVKVTTLMLSYHKISNEEMGISSSLSWDYSYIISVFTLARHLYLASALDLGTMVCFLVDHIIGLAPRKMYKLDVKHLVSRQESQSKSKNSLMCRPLEGWNSNPWLMVPCKYLKILFTTPHSASLGWLMYRDTLFSIKAISCLMVVTYWSALMMPLYNARLTKPLPSLAPSFKLDTIGVIASLALVT